LDPHINIWQVAKPVVEGYISRNLGPLALLRDLAQTARVLARFGPRLPHLVEAALIAQADAPPPMKPPRTRRRLAQAALAIVLLAGGFWLGRLL
jgi:ubiquinone biosynthesis protein